MSMDLMGDIEAQLRRRGHMQVNVATDDEADQWKNAARAAARRLSRPVETIQHCHIVVAALKDWPGNALEQQVQDAGLRNVINRIPNPLG